jgi:hypothetical protein
MEWFSALEVAERKKSSKNQPKCLPISRTRSSKTNKRFAMKQLFKERGRWPKPPYMSVLALDREDIS